MSIITSSIRNSDGTPYTITTDSSSDWSSVAVGTYFKNLSDGLIRYKMPNGDIQNVITFPFSGSAVITGSLNVSAGITGSLLGTSSWAQNAVNNISWYGSFFDTTTQTNVASTARSMSFNTTDISNGVSISGSASPFNTYIKVANAGVYNIQFSAQTDKTDSGTDEIWIWLRKTGSNVDNSATSLQLIGNGAHYVAAWNFFVNAQANDYYQLMWYSTDANVRLHAEAGFGDVPAVPSVILTVNRIAT